MGGLIYRIRVVENRMGAVNHRVSALANRMGAVNHRAGVLKNRMKGGFHPSHPARQASGGLNHPFPVVLRCFGGLGCLGGSAWGRGESAFGGIDNQQGQMGGRAARLFSALTGNGRGEIGSGLGEIRPVGERGPEVIRGGVRPAVL